MAHGRRFIPSTPARFNCGCGGGYARPNCGCGYARPNESAFLMGCRDLLEKEPKGKTAQHDECRAALANEEAAAAEFEEAEKKKRNEERRLRRQGQKADMLTAEAELALEGQTVSAAGSAPGSYLPPTTTPPEAETPTWMYVAGGLAALAAVGGAVYWYNRD